MKRVGKSLAVTTLLMVGVQAVAQTPATPATASKPISTSLGMVVFPAKGQTPQKQSQDEGECYAWSKGQTGVDPMALPPAAAQPAAQTAAQQATQQQQQATQQTQAAKQQQLDLFKKGFAACLEPKGYTVK